MIYKKNMQRGKRTKIKNPMEYSYLMEKQKKGSQQRRNLQKADESKEYQKKTETQTGSLQKIKQ